MQTSITSIIEVEGESKYTCYVTLEGNRLKDGKIMDIEKITKLSKPILMELVDSKIQTLEDICNRIFVKLREKTVLIKKVSVKKDHYGYAEVYY